MIFSGISTSKRALHLCPKPQVSVKSTRKFLVKCENVVQDAVHTAQDEMDPADADVALAFLRTCRPCSSELSVTDSSSARPLSLF